MDPRTHLAITTALILAAVTLGYAAGCWIWPFRACRRCDGFGRRRSPFSRAYRICRRCDGTGLRLRVGRWIYNHISHWYKEIHR